MECTKCHKFVPDNTTICPHCKKVLALECPNCHSLQHNPICEQCGYIILEKCAKCGKLVPTTNETCKCGYPVKSSIAYQECENDEFATLIIKFNSLNNIRNLLGSQNLYDKFYTKLTNLLLAQLQNGENKVILHKNQYIVNFNKELSLSTASNKAIRLALKIANSFSSLNLKILQELGTSINLSMTIIKKNAEDLLEIDTVNNNVKLLNVKKESAKYLHGMQVILDQYIQDSIGKDYKTDSLYAFELNGNSVMFYEVLLENYVVPPNTSSSELDDIPDLKVIKKINLEEKEEEDMYAFKVFDIKAKCKFEKSNAIDIINKLDINRIISIKAKPEQWLKTSDILFYYEKQGINVLHAVCTEELNYQPWGVLTKLYRDYYNLSESSNLIDEQFDVKIFSNLTKLLFEKKQKASSTEDARFAYMEEFSKFLASLKNCAIVIENFEKIDDTSLQVFELFFEKFKTLNSTFLFVTNNENSVHTKIKYLLQSENYVEYELCKTTIEDLTSNIKEEASDFIKSFYYEKIGDNFRGSKIYFDHAMRYLFDKEIIISFENKLFLKNNKSVMLPTDLFSLIKTRLKHFSKNMDFSMVLAYSNYLGPRLDFKTLNALGIKNVEKTAEEIQKEGFGFVKSETVYINNYGIMKEVLQSSLKPQVEDMLLKNIFAKLGNGLSTTLTLLFMGKIQMYKEQYLMLWKNSQFAIGVGDYDAYLKNSLGFLSILENLNEDIPEDQVLQSKMEVYQNIIQCLYSYSPVKIYSIENILLEDAIYNEDNEQIVKISNLMLQGALLSSNYTEAQSLLHNILKRMSDTKLVKDGTINTKFLLLSLINIEILFNIGEFNECIQIADSLLEVIKPDLIEQIKPSNFTASLFIEHLMETFRLVSIAKIIVGNTDFESYLNQVNKALGKKLSDAESLTVLKEYLAGKDYTPSNTEETTPFSKLIYLIINEFSTHLNDYKNFAQNIYQAKLLANELRQTQIEYICELLIAHSYDKLGIHKKAEFIYKDIAEKSDNNAVFNIAVLAKYFIAKQKFDNRQFQDALFYINDALAMIQNKSNEAKLLYAFIQKLFINIIQNYDTQLFNVNNEEQKLLNISANNEFRRIIGTQYAET